MKKIRNILMTLFAGFLLVALVLYVGGEFLHWDLAFLEDSTKEQKFICSTVMILLTICLLPLSLRLFKFRRVSNDLKQRKAPALLQWGSLRIVTMGLLLVVNTFLYYAFGFESAYGYLAVVTLLCMPFVVPTMNRCVEEVSDEPVSVPENKDLENDTNESFEDEVETV